MDFAALVDELLAGYFRLHPDHATEIGEHAYDGVWPDLTDAGRVERSAWADGWITRLERLDGAALSRDERIDRRILLDNLRAIQFGEEELRESSWSPLSYVYLFGNGLFALLAREFAPLPDRLRSAASRMSGLPAALVAARETLEAGGPRPVSRFHAEKAVDRMSGITELCHAAVREAEGHGDATLAEEVRLAAQEAEAAVDRFTTWLRDELLPGADGDFRLGPELYAAKFRHALQTDFSPDELEARAREAYDNVRGEMARIGRALWPAWVGDEPTPADDNVVIRRVLDAIAAEHPPAEALLDFCREENQRIEAFVRERDLVGLPDDPLQIVWTPEFLRAFGG
ncbi:MAG TPA: DUF885 family protein, partial [Candidatus Limnocylindria bacterium]|nr:DUF885 family protein [Candidatus Limnocylindria bacterium]